MDIRHAIVGLGLAGIVCRAAPFDETACWRAGAVADPYHDRGWQLVDFRRIWVNPGFPEGDPALRHNAFSSLARFRGQWYCGFRSAANHGTGAAGHVRVIRSADGLTWEPVALFPPSIMGADLRDPKLIVTPAGELVATTSEVYNHGPAKAEFVDAQGITRRTVGWTSVDGTTWRGPSYSDEGVNTWIWNGAAWRDGVGYGVAYHGRHLEGAIFTTSDGLDWDLHQDAVFPPRSDLEKEHGNASGNEATLVFAPEGRAYMYLRGGPRSGGSHFGTADPPYREWTWKSRLQTIGGPKMLRLVDGRFVIGGREGWGNPHSNNTMALWELDPAKASFTEILRLPSGGDCGYPGIVEHEGELWIAYYSSHEDPNPEGRNLWHHRANIYLARLRIGVAD